MTVVVLARAFFSLFTGMKWPTATKQQRKNTWKSSIGISTSSTKEHHASQRQSMDVAVILCVFLLVIRSMFIADRILLFNKQLLWHFCLMQKWQQVTIDSIAMAFEWIVIWLGASDVERQSFVCQCIRTRTHIWIFSGGRKRLFFICTSCNYVSWLFGFSAQQVEVPMRFVANFEFSFESIEMQFLFDMRWLCIAFECMPRRRTFELFSTIADGWQRVQPAHEWKDNKYCSTSVLIEFNSIRLNLSVILSHCTVK